MNKITRSQFFALALGAALFTSSSAAAQLPCNFGDDGFAGPCCDSATPDLPDFPPVITAGSYACIDNCSQVTDFDVRVQVSELDWFACDMARVKVTMTPTTLGGPNFAGKLVAKYSRTWRLSNGNQVWRFLLNGDVKYGNSIGTFGCPQPPNQGPQHFIGHIDYTCSSFAVQPDISLSLSLLPGCISHGPLSERPLTGAAAHPGTSYHLVTPAGFNWLAATAPEGRTVAEAVRPASEGDCFPSTYKCLTEIPVRDGEIASSFRNCLCQSFINGPWTHQKISGEGDCQGAPLAYKSVSGFDPAVPTGLVTLPLGRWSGNSWMNDVELSVHFGYFRLVEPCGAVDEDDPQRIHGVTTSGLKGKLFTPQLTAFKVFIDYQNHRVPSISPSPCLLLKNGFGAPAYSSVVWNLNLAP